MSRSVLAAQINQDTREVAIEEEIAGQVRIAPFADLEQSEHRPPHHPSQLRPMALQMVRCQQADVHARMQHERIHEASGRPAVLFGHRVQPLQEVRPVGLARVLEHVVHHLQPGHVVLDMVEHQGVHCFTEQKRRPGHLAHADLGLPVRSGDTDDEHAVHAHVNRR